MMSKWLPRKSSVASSVVDEGGSEGASAVSGAHPPAASHVVLQVRRGKGSEMWLESVAGG